MNPTRFDRQTQYQLPMHRHRPDYRLVLLTGLLLLTGLIVVYAISPALSYRLFAEYREQHFLYRQLLHIGVGIGAFLVASHIPIATWRRSTRFFIYGAVALNAMLLVPGLGVTVKGATRWLNLGPLSSFQPAELLKLALILLVADRLARMRDEDLNSSTAITKPALSLLAIVGAVVVILQRDMGTMLVIATIICGMLFMAGAGNKQMGQILGSLTAGAILAIVMFPHRMSRLLTFLQPGDDVQGAGYHVNQSLIAIGSGGVLGLGLGRSLQVYGYLPEAANDSIFAIFAEKFGFAGCVLLLAAFGFLLQRILSIALRAPDTYTQLLSGGVLIWLASHILINIGAMVALLPLTGITLPFLSIGGSSLLLMLFALGLVFQISRYTHYRVQEPALGPLGARLRNG